MKVKKVLSYKDIFIYIKIYLPIVPLHLFQKQVGIVLSRPFVIGPHYVMSLHKWDERECVKCLFQGMSLTVVWGLVHSFSSHMVTGNIQALNEWRPPCPPLTDMWHERQRKWLFSATKIWGWYHHSIMCPFLLIKWFSLWIVCTTFWNKYWLNVYPLIFNHEKDIGKVFQRLRQRLE